MNNPEQTKLFTKVLFLFLSLGVAPILLIALTFSRPFHLEFVQYKNLVGVLLILSTVSTLCLAGLATRLLKHPINRLLEAQKQVRHGNLAYRLPVVGNPELNLLFSGFNKMAEGIENASRQEQQLAEQRSFNKLASQVIHDLRSPLSTLKVAGEICLTHASSHSECEKCAELTQMSLKRLEDIIADLLTKRKTASSSFALHEVLEELFKELALSEKYPNLVLQKKFHKTPIQMDVGKNDLKRVLTNIVTNAIEAMNEKGCLTLATAVSDGAVCIDIQDTGPGMAPEILEKVLQGGFTYNKTNGNGIGMTVVREMVEKYNGKLTATSAPGKGTLFHVQIPMSDAAPSLLVS